MNGAKFVSVFEATDIVKSKKYAALAYILFFIPLLACPDSSFGKFHANQSLLLLITTIVARTVIRMLPFLNGALRSIFGIAVLGLMIYGIYNALKGKAYRLPVIGQFNILH